MKKLLILLTTTLIFYGTIWAQCPTGNVTLTSQQQVNDFAAAYPNCTQIAGYLTIGIYETSNDIVDLQALSNITTINSNLRILRTDASLSDLTGLSNLVSVGGYLRIFSSDGLISLAGLENLTSIGADLRVIGNTTLTDITALNNVSSTITGLRIEDNPQLSICNASVICNYLAGGGSATIRFNNSGCNSVNQVSYSCTPDGSCTLPSSLSQQDIDDFPINYPGCTVIEGDADIDYYVTNFSGLNQITTINGNFTIFDADITDFSGLENLETIGGDFTVDSNYELNDFEGLESLTTIGGDFFVGGNDLVDFSGLGSLTSIGGDFELLNNAYLSGFAGLDNLTSIAGSFIIDGGHYFAMLDGLNSLNSIGGDLYMSILPLLVDISTLNNLTTVGGNFTLDNTQLTTLTGLENLTSIGGQLSIISNNSLTNLSAIENLDHTTITNLIIRYNNNLSVCDVTSICNYLAAGGTATISDNAFGCATQSEVENLCMDGPVCPPGSVVISTQQEIDDFPSNYPDCTVINGDLSISEGFTDPITNLNGLSQIETITGNLTFGDYLNVPDLTAFNNLTSVGGDLSFINSRVISLNGLENLTSVGGNLTLEDNALLTDISGLSGLTSLSGNLVIRNNDNLSNLIGLENLTTITGVLNISDNGALTTLSAIENLDHIGIIYLIIENNTNLSVCSITSICNYLAAAGPSSIFNNASGCNTQAEVEVICNDPCLVTPVMSVNDQPILDGIYQAANEVNSVGTVPVGGNVNFKAGQVILLDQNFIIEPNADFSAEIEDCGQ